MRIHSQVFVYGELKCELRAGASWEKPLRVGEFASSSRTRNHPYEKHRPCPPWVGHGDQEPAREVPRVPVRPLPRAGRRAPAIPPGAMQELHPAERPKEVQAHSKDAGSVQVNRGQYYITIS